MTFHFSFFVGDCLGRCGGSFLYKTSDVGKEKITEALENMYIIPVSYALYYWIFNQEPVMLG